jgi:hypothetical protein
MNLESSTCPFIYLEYVLQDKYGAYLNTKFRIFLHCKPINSMVLTGLQGEQILNLIFKYAPYPLSNTYSEYINGYVHDANHLYYSEYGNE